MHLSVWAAISVVVPFERESRFIGLGIKITLLLVTATSYFLLVSYFKLFISCKELRHSVVLHVASLAVQV